MANFAMSMGIWPIGLVGWFMPGLSQKENLFFIGVMLRDASIQAIFSLALKKRTCRIAFAKAD